MPRGARVQLNLTEIRKVPVRKDVTEVLMKIGEQVAGRAAMDAPKKTGEGARSIHPEKGKNGDVNVGWDRDHFYMLFSEVGTSRQPARPFLRPALDSTYDI